MTHAPLAEITEALRSNPLFAELSDEHLEAFAGEVWLEEIPAGSVIVREGDQADALYVVVSGGVNVTKANGQFLAYLGPGGFFGEMALFLEHSQRSATCSSAADTTCAIIRRSVLDQFCSSVPVAGVTIYRAIISTLAERLQITSADLAVLMAAQVRSQSTIDDMVAAAKNKKKKKS